VLNDRAAGYGLPHRLLYRFISAQRQFPYMNTAIFRSCNHTCAVGFAASQTFPAIHCCSHRSTMVEVHQSQRPIGCSHNTVPPAREVVHSAYGRALRKHPFPNSWTLAHVPNHHLAALISRNDHVAFIRVNIQRSHRRVVLGQLHSRASGRAPPALGEGAALGHVPQLHGGVPGAGEQAPRSGCDPHSSHRILVSCKPPEAASVVH